MLGKIFVIGTGPGDAGYICPEAMTAMEASDLIVGYKTYIQLIQPLLPHKPMQASGMMKEVERCEQVLALALAGQTVSLISSGDAGVYGMAGIMLEVAADHPQLCVEVIPGVSAANAAAALLGAPLMNDYVVLSLSDLLTPWEMIVKRLHAAGQGDFAIAIYNPKSKTRVEQLTKAMEILLQYKAPDTPCGIVRNAMREEQTIGTCRLDEVCDQYIDMFTILVIGNSQTRLINERMVTRRGYQLSH